MTAAPRTATDVLRVANLAVSFHGPSAPIPAVIDVSFQVAASERLAVLGESGSGKTVTALSVMGLLPPENVARLDGHVWFGDVDLLHLQDPDWRRFRGSRIGMVFQDPLTSLNPLVPVGKQITEGLYRKGAISREQRHRVAADLMRRVGIPDAANRVRDLPFQFSGGMRQRVMIAIAIAEEPTLLIADEPTTALDVTTQAQIMALLEELCDRTGMALLLISHDIGLVADHSDRMVVMYGGRVMETGPTPVVLAGSLNPYTRGLLGSIPNPKAAGDDVLQAIPGRPPESAVEVGCPFAARCPMSQDVCRQVAPPLVAAAPGHQTACHFWEELRDE
jgi:oligopeptide transport system ATP-binding protein